MPRNCVSSGVQNYQASVSTVSFPVAFINNMRLNEDIPCPGASFSDAFIAVVTSSWAPLPLKGIFFSVQIWSTEWGLCGKLGIQTFGAGDLLQTHTAHCI